MSIKGRDLVSSVTLGNISSIATLILFIFYFIGRIWTINKQKILMCESFDLENNKFDPDFAERAEIYYDINGGEVISMVSDVPILWLHVIPVEYNQNAVDITPSNAKPIIKHETPIRSGCPVYLRMDIPDVLPAFKIRFQRFDYVIVSFHVGYNGKCGGMQPIDYRITHTLKSYLYYLLK